MPDLAQLAKLSGHRLEQLQRLIATRPSVHGRHLLVACRFCTVRRGITNPVVISAGDHQQVCRRHRRWLARRGDPVGEQFDLSAVPDVLTANRRHRRLLHQHGPAEMRAVFGTAAHILFRWTARGNWPEHRDRRVGHFYDLSRWRLTEHHPLIPLANYPETVALAGLLIDTGAAIEPIWRDEASLEQFCTQLSRRLRIRYRARGSVKRNRSSGRHARTGHRMSWSWWGGRKQTRRRSPLPRGSRSMPHEAPPRVFIKSCGADHGHRRLGGAIADRLMDQVFATSRHRLQEHDSSHFIVFGSVHVRNQPCEAPVAAPRVRARRDPSEPIPAMGSIGLHDLRLNRPRSRFPLRAVRTTQSPGVSPPGPFGCARQAASASAALVAGRPIRPSRSVLEVSSAPFAIAVSQPASICATSVGSPAPSSVCWYSSTDWST